MGGRPGAMRPELMSILNATEANCVHYQVKADVSDGTTINDMLGQIVRIPVPTNYLHIEDIIAGLRQKLKKKPIMKFLKSAMMDMQGYKNQLSNDIAAGGRLEPAQLAQLQEKERKVSEVIAEIQKEIDAKQV